MRQNWRFENLYFYNGPYLFPEQFRLIFLSLPILITIPRRKKKLSTLIEQVKTLKDE